MQDSKILMNFWSQRQLRYREFLLEDSNFRELLQSIPLPEPAKWDTGETWDDMLKDRLHRERIRGQKEGAIRVLTYLGLSQKQED